MTDGREDARPVAPPTPWKKVGVWSVGVALAAMATDWVLPGPAYISILVWIWALTVWLIGFMLLVVWPEPPADER